MPVPPSQSDSSDHGYGSGIPDTGAASSKVQAGYDLMLELFSFRLPQMSSFRLPLTRGRHEKVGAVDGYGSVSPAAALVIGNAEYKHAS